MFFYFVMILIKTNQYLQVKIASTEATDSSLYQYKPRRSYVKLQQSQA